MSVTRSPVRSHVRNIARGLTDLAGGVVTPQTHVFLLAGQSNMVGTATYDSLGDFASGTQEWNGTTLSAATSPLRSGGAGTMGPIITFVDDYLAVNSIVESVVLIQSAISGTGFTANDWNQGDTRYNNAVSDANSLMTANPDFKFKGILWIQGEADAGLGEAGYAAVLDPMIAAMRSDINVATSSTPFILGNIAITRSAATRAAITDTPNRVPYTAVANTDDLTTSDGTHYDAASCRTLGSRLEDAFYVGRANGPRAPDAPTSFALAAGDGRLTASWTAPDFDGHDAITSYRVYYREVGSGTWLLFGSTASTSLDITGLTNDTDYEGYATAVNTNGESVASNTDSQAPTAQSPVDAMLAALGNSSVALAWLYNDTTTQTVETDETGGAPADGDSIGTIDDAVASAYLAVATSDANRLIFRSASGGYAEGDGAGDRMLVSPFTDGLTDMVYHSIIRTTDTRFALVGGQSISQSVGLCLDGDTSTAVQLGAGSPTYYADGVEQTSPTRDSLHAAYATGDWVEAEVEDIDQSTWTVLDEWDAGFSSWDFGGDRVATVIYSKTGLSASDIAAIKAGMASLVPA